MTFGRNIRLFLVDGTPLGLITAEIPNWTGHVLAAPRARISEALAREEAGRTGIYLLVGDDQSGGTKVYVGEGDCIRERVKDHAKDDDKEFWERVCLITSKDVNLTKAHVRYLESKLVEVIRENGRAESVNKQTPGGRLLPEADIADMEFFITQLQLLLPTLGMNFLLPKPTMLSVSDTRKAATLQADGQSEKDAVSVELFLSHDSTGVNARGIDVDGELTVLRGSIGTNRAFAHNTYASLRERLIESGKISVQGDTTAFLEDIVFASSSAAAAVLNNHNSAGPREWRLKDGTTLRVWRDRMLDVI